MLTSRTTGASSLAFSSSIKLRLFAFGAEFDLFLVEAGHHVFVRGTRQVEALDGSRNRGLRGDDGLDVEAGQELDVRRWRGGSSDRPSP